MQCFGGLTYPEVKVHFFVNFDSLREICGSTSMCCNGDVELVISCHHDFVSLKLHQSPKKSILKTKRRDGEVSRHGGDTGDAVTLSISILTQY